MTADEAIDFLFAHGEQALDVAIAAQKKAEPALHNTQHGQQKICPNCSNGWNVDHSGLFCGSRKCITCGGTGKLPA